MDKPFSAAAELDELIALARATRETPGWLEGLEAICAAVLDCLARGGKLLTLGNGGSAADALHLAEELLGQYRGRRRALPAISLVADATALTCIANDYGFDRIFARQVEALGQPGDMLIVFSTSGNSANALRALEAARERGLVTVGLLGKDGGAAAGLCDFKLIVASRNTARIQEMHTLALHVICEAAERAYAAGEEGG